MKKYFTVMFSNMVLPESFCPCIIPAKNAKEAREKAFQNIKNKLTELKMQYIIQGITLVSEINPKSGAEYSCTIFTENDTVLG